MLEESEQKANQQYEKMQNVVKSNHQKFTSTITKKDELISNLENKLKKYEKEMIKLTKHSREKENELENVVIQKDIEIEKQKKLHTQAEKQCNALSQKLN